MIAFVDTFEVEGIYDTSVIDICDAVGAKGDIKDTGIFVVAGVDAEVMDFIDKGLNGIVIGY